jgi:ABC-type antimicrobial peptide transport system permease subunit
VFHLHYITSELRRRLARTVLTALGLALGVGLVIGIIGVSQGLDEAQDDVLAPLGSVGTDILVTRVAGATPASGDAAAATTTTAPNQGRPAPGRGGGFFAAGGPGGQGDVLNQADSAALLNENNNVVTDLKSLGEPGTQFTHDFFLSATLLSFPDAAIDNIAKIDGVSSATGGLVQQVQHQTGTVPQIVAEIQTGGETVTQTVRPDPPTDAEQAEIQQCLADKGFSIGPPPDQGAGGQGSGGQGGGGVTRGPGGGGGPGGAAFQECLPQRFREFQASVITPLRSIQQVVNPPSTDITNTSYSAGGVDPTTPDQGLVTREQLVGGRWIAKGATNEVLLNVAYANSKSLEVGSKLPINGTDYEVVGLVNPTLTGSIADVYFPLETLQQLAGKNGRVTQVLVKVDSAGDVDRVAADIEKQLPGAEVVTTKALANQVEGSLADARSLADKVGGALAVIVLGAAFVIAVLLTLSSIAKRVREIGTLRAIGWSKGRVVRQLLGETLGIGVLGGLLGVAVGVGVAAAIGAFSPELSATTAGVPGAGSSTLSGFFNQAASVAQTTKVGLSAPLSATTLAIGVVFALVGGLLAGLIGGWRAARLAPVVALRDLG